MSTNDRLYEELLRPILDDYCDIARTLAGASDDSNPSVQMAVLSRLHTLQECGDRTARVLELDTPLWDQMRALEGLPW